MLIDAHKEPESNHQWPFTIIQKWRWGLPNSDCNGVWRNQGPTSWTQTQGGNRRNGTIYYPKEEEIQQAISWKNRSYSLLGWERSYSCVLLARGTKMNPSPYTQTLSPNAGFHQVCPIRKMSKVLLLHNDTRPHTNRCIKEAITNSGWRVLLQTFYSPDLAPSDYRPFGPWTKHLQRHHLCQSQGTTEWHGPWLQQRDSNFYQVEIYDLVQRWKKSVNKDVNCNIKKN